MVDAPQEPQENPDEELDDISDDLEDVKTDVRGLIDQLRDQTDAPLRRAVRLSGDEYVRLVVERLGRHGRRATGLGVGHCYRNLVGTNL